MTRRERPTAADELENAQHTEAIDRARARRFARLKHPGIGTLAWFVRLAWAIRAQNRGQCDRDQLLTAAGRMNVIGDPHGRIAQWAIERTDPKARRP